MLFGQLSFVEDNYFQLLFNEHIPSYEENIIEGRNEIMVPTSFPYDYSIVVVCLPNPPFYEYKKIFLQWRALSIQIHMNAMSLLSTLLSHSHVLNWELV